MTSENLSRLIPGALGLLGVGLLAHWLAAGPGVGPIAARVPGLDKAPAAGATTQPAVDLKGMLTRGEGSPADWPGAWPTFRGARLDNISTDEVPLARQWGASGPPQIWSVPVGEGYAGAAIDQGRAYLIDYDQAKRQDVVRCLSLRDGKEIFRHAYGVDITRNHGISRTVPAVAKGVVVTLGPKCHVVCLDAATGEFKWGIDLVAQYGTTVPQWYAGQCPLIDGETLVLAPAGPDAMLVGIELATGKELWRVPNPEPELWKMTHSSVLPMDVAGRRVYVYCASGGVVGVTVDGGKASVAFKTDAWKVSLATVATPVPVGDGRVFFSGGYGSGSLMARLVPEGAGFRFETVYRLKPDQFGAEQHTPVLFDGFLYGIIPGGQLVCMDLDGKRRWASGAKNRFGLGPFMIARDGASGAVILALSERGSLTMAEATPDGFKPLATAEVLSDAHEAWGPLALAGGRLIARDMHRLICLDLRRTP